MTPSSPSTQNILRFALAIFLLLAGAVCLGSLHPALLLAGYGISIGIALWLAIDIARGDRGILLSPVTLAAFVLFLYGTALIPRSPHLIPAIESHLQFLQILLVSVFVSYTLGCGWQRETWTDAILSMAIVLSIIELGFYGLWTAQKAHIAGLSLASILTGYRASGSLLGHPNILSGYLNLALLLTLDRLRRASSPSSRLPWVAAILVLLPVQYLTSSRGGWVALLGGLGVYALVALAPRARDFKAWFQGKSRPHRLLMSLAVTFILLSAIGGFAWLLLIQQRFSPGHSPFLTARSGIWGPALDILMKSPWLGHGPASYSTYFALETQAPPGFATNHAHNLLLQIGCEYGIVGLVLLGWLLLRVMRNLISAWRGASEERYRRVALMAGVLTVILIHHLVDFLFQSPLYALAALILLSIPWGERTQSFQRAKSNRLGIGAIVLGMLVAIGAVYTLRGSFLYWRGVGEVREGNLEKGKSLICEAFERRPDFAFYGFQCGLLQAREGVLSADRGRLAQAEWAISAALATDPYWPIHQANHAMLLWELGDQSAALEEMRAAAASAPRNTSILLSLGWMLEKSGRLEGAKSIYRHSLRVDPWLKYRAFFRASDLRSELGSGDRLDGYLSGASVLLWYGLHALEEGRLSIAEHDFRMALKMDPLHSGPLVGLAEVYLRKGDQVSAFRHAQQALLVSRGWPRYEILGLMSRILARQGKPDDSLLALELAFDEIDRDSQSTQYFALTYRRYPLRPDRVPLLQRGYLTPSLVDSLATLLRHVEDGGESERARRIELLLQNEIGE